MDNGSNHGLGPTRARVLQYLQSASNPVAVAEIAENLHMHKNSARFHLSALLEMGFITESQVRTGGQGRPHMVYRATGISPLVSNQHLFELTHLLIRNFVHDEPDGLQRARKLGEDWGNTEGANVTDAEDEEIVEELVTSMSERGFASVPDGQRVEFIRCPFRSDSISDTEMDVVCAIHQGFIDGYLDGSGAPLHAKEMLVGPTCKLTLETVQKTGDRESGTIDDPPTKRV